MTKKLTIKSYFDNWEEIFIGATLQFPIIFIIEWWALPVMVLTGLLWRLGGAEGGNNLFRRLGVPIAICTSTWLVLGDWGIFLAVPFMVWVNPMSYGKSSKVYQFFLKHHKGNTKKADMSARLSGFFWYWVAYHIALFARF